MTLRTVLARRLLQIPVLLSVALCFALARPGMGQPSDKRESELWYVVTLQGEHAGWMRSSEEIVDDRVTTEVEWNLRVSRAGTAVSSSKRGRFIEQADGTPVSFWIRQDLGAEPSETLYEFEGNEIKVKLSQAGHSSTTTRPAPDGAWQTPHQVGQFIAARLRSGVDQFTCRAIDVLGDLDPVTTTRQRLAEDVELEVRGKRIRASKWRTVQSDLADIASIEYFDADGLLVRSEVEVGGMSIVTLLADETSARPVGGGPEMMLKTFVRPSRPIARANRLKRAVFDLSVADGKLPPIPDAGAQRIERFEGESERVRLDIDASARRPAEVDPSDFLVSSRLVTADDKLVQELARRAVRGVRADPERQAEAIRGFVGRYIRRKSLGVGLASAAEVARDREGDCTEHAVLTTAMLRATGIPARIATGLVLVDEFAGQKSIFGYHMWSQALIDGAWVDFDAAMPHRFDATHIALSLSAMNEDEFLGEMTSLLPLMGRLRIDVVELDY